MKELTIFIISYLILLISNAQSTFELILDNDEDQVPFGLIEDNNSNIIFSIFDKPDAHLLKINNEGEIIDSLNFASPENGDCNISEFIKCDNDYFVAFGEYNTETTFYLWYLKFDFNLSLLKNILIPVPDKIMGTYTNCLINSKGNFVVSACYGQQINDRDIFVIELDTNGTILKENYWGSGSSGIKIIFDIAEQANLKYYFTCNSLNLNGKESCNIYELDSNLSITNQQSAGFGIGNLSEIKFIEDSVFLLSGIKTYDLPDLEVQLGLLKYDLNYNHLDSIAYGKWGNDTIDYPAFQNNIRITSNGNIYYGGTSNLDVFNPFYTTIPSWFMLVKLNNQFEEQWINYYGGDVYYNLMSILATQDGGCVMAGTRYDYQTQNQERDVYILKVNEDGILTWTYNFPETTKQVIIYPNPGHDEIRIKALSDNLIFDLFDIKGNKILSQQIKKETRITTSHLQKGVYTYRILNQKSETIETGKWMKD